MSRGLVQRWRTPSLRHRLLTALCLFSLIPLALAAGAVYVVQRRAILEQAFAHLEMALEQRAARIRSWLQVRREELQFLTAMPALAQSGRRLIEDRDPSVVREQLRAALRERLRLARNSLLEFEELFLLDAQRGRVLVSSDPAQEGKLKDDRPYYREGR
ncbi:MAG: cache domain-containing protein, partial [Deltaproteobacteria bacterium]|nr:cache domain-containing protein [Deltaproteobacteria bacterium]